MEYAPTSPTHSFLVNLGASSPNYQMRVRPNMSITILDFPNNTFHRLNGSFLTNSAATEPKPEILSCEFIPEMPFPWNGAYLEWCRELAGEPR